MKVKFVAKISPMGDKLIMIIPKEFHSKVKNSLGKQIMVQLNELG